MTKYLSGRLNIANKINRAIDIQALPSGMTANFMVLVAFDPSVTGYRIMLGTSGIHEINSVLGRFACFEFFMVFHKSMLFLGISLTRCQFRYFLDIAHLA